MNCEHAKPLIQLNADGELDTARILELEQHLRDCPACAVLARDLQSLKKALQHDRLYFNAPAELRRRIKAELHSKVTSEVERKFWNWSWLATATTGAAAACVALLLAVTMARPSAQQRLAQELVSSHVRSLMANHALDVASSDQHTVKPWFDGKLDFSPPVKDLTAQEYPLLGGRLDYLGGQAVAALVYQRHKHVINLFIWPTSDTDSKPRAGSTMQGYHRIHWVQAGMNFWAVSDLNEKELTEFIRIFASN